MDFTNLALPAVLLVSLTSIGLLLVSDWRASISLLALQYLGVFVLVGLSWPLGMAAAKLVAGWIAGAVLAMAMVSLPPAPALPAARKLARKLWDPGRVFQLLAAALVGLTVLSIAPHLAEWLPVVGVEQAWGALILTGMGLLQLGFTGRPLPTVMGLLTAFAGFEILYAAVEASALVAGLLAGVILGLALAGAYLLVAPSMEATE